MSVDRRKMLGLGGEMGKVATTTEAASSRSPNASGPDDSGPNHSGPTVALSPTRAPRWPRPPGAIEERAFQARCDGCGDCIVACPYRAIHSVPGGSGGTSTPVMVTQSRPCHLCEGFPCVTACKTGALSPTLAKEAFFGIAVIDEQQCLPFRGPECGACAGQCPGGVRALRLQRGRPVIDDAACMGCGLCASACPTRPSAIRIVWAAASGEHAGK
jgi:MauM/NapG family ferredoxin protein